MNWLHLRRLFHFDGSLGGLRYEARLGMFELGTDNGLDRTSEVHGHSRKRLLLAAERSLAFELQAWESEGGARMRTKLYNDRTEGT